MEPIIRITRIKKEVTMKKLSFLGFVVIGTLSLMLTLSSSWAQSGRRPVDNSRTAWF